MNEWIEAVARRVSAEPGEAEAVLNQFRIRATSALPRPRQLLVHRISFAGTKQIAGDSTEFEFDFPMGSGVWCLASDEENQAGKSSVLEIMLWCLSGRSHVQDDVRSWLARVEMEGSIDQERFAVRFDTQNGRPRGALSVLDPEERVMTRFETGIEFEHVMNDFMLDRLGLEPTPFWQGRVGEPNGEGDPSALSWPGYVRALYVPDASHKVLLGEEAMGGQAGKLLSVFIGLPWTQTHAAAQVAARAEEQSLRHEARRRAEDARVRGAELANLEQRLSAIQRDLASVADEGRLILDLERALAESHALSASLDAAQVQWADAVQAARHTDAAVRADRRRLLDLQETDLAHRFFHTLEPTVCPRCDHSIGADRRRREAEEAHCAVCGTGLTATEQQDDLIQEATDSLSATEQAWSQATGALRAAKSGLETANAQYQVSRSQVLQMLEHQSAFSRRRTLELEEARVLGMIEERRKTLEFTGGNAVQKDFRLRVLKAAEQEAEARINAAKSNFFDELNAEVLRLAHAFGMSALESVGVDRSARMAIVKGGTETWFSKVTKGERLRLKIAVVIALLRLGERRGIGRHPGLLVIDSPGAEEVAADDVTTELDELYRVAGELKHVQIVLSSARVDLVRRVLPEDRVRTGPGGKKLW